MGVSDSTPPADSHPGKVRLMKAEAHWLAPSGKSRGDACNRGRKLTWGAAPRRKTPKMTAEKAERLASLFLAFFSTGLALQLATTGALTAAGWVGAVIATLGSISLAVGVRVWPRAAEAAVSRRRSRD